MDNVENFRVTAARADEVVARVWEKVLDVPAKRHIRLLDVLSNYSGVERSQRLGGVLLEIGAATDVHLPLTVAFGSPDAAELSMMVRNRAWPRYERPVKVSSVPGEALFVFPGIGGLGLDVLGLMRHLTFDGPIYLNTPRGIDGAEPDDVLDVVVADHIACIRTVQPNGPYWLLGYSWGGLIALEISRVLQSSGETIAFLGMIDPVLNPIDWTYRAWLQFIGARFHLHLMKMCESGSILAATRYATRCAVPFFDKVVRLFGVNRLWSLEDGGSGLPAELVAVWNAESKMIKAYRLLPYDGAVTLFATHSGHAAEVSPEKVWPFKVSRLDLRWMPGDHLLSEPEVAGSAKVVSAVLAQNRSREASARKPCPADDNG
jgi:thioesterase domain-containing protein